MFNLALHTSVFPQFDINCSLFSLWRFWCVYQIQQIFLFFFYNCWNILFKVKVNQHTRENERVRDHLRNVHVHAGLQRNYCLKLHLHPIWRCAGTSQGCRVREMSLLTWRDPLNNIKSCRLSSCFLCWSVTRSAAAKKLVLTSFASDVCFFFFFFGCSQIKNAGASLKINGKKLHFHHHRAWF